MAKLSDQEIALLKKLQAKSEAPDPPGVSGINLTINLGDKDQFEYAKRHGLLPSDEEEEVESDGTEEEAEPDDDAPKRKGYFG